MPERVYVVVYRSPWVEDGGAVEVFGVWATREAAVEAIGRQPGVRPSSLGSSGFCDYEIEACEVRGGES